MPSRNPFVFQRRNLLRPLNWPSSTFSTKQLLVRQYVDENVKSLQELIAGEGAPPPDRVMLNDWSPLQPAEETGEP